VTGAAGFIGAAVTRALLDRGERVVGIDNVNAYYEVSLKEARLARLQDPNFEFRRIDLSDTAAMDRLFDEVRPNRVHNGRRDRIRADHGIPADDDAACEFDALREVVSRVLRRVKGKPVNRRPSAVEKKRPADAGLFWNR
jgi:NAD(P)-dependent dehydrogenase (short-subunit alcohol dehydrogenase family)